MAQYGSGLVTVDDGLSDNDSEGEDNRGTIADGPGTEGMEALLESLARGEEPVGQSSKWQRRNLDLGVDLLINAADERLGVGCRRKVFDVCFNNAAAESDHHECNSADTQGCTRCNIMEPAICCDVHNPTDFSSYETHIPKTPRATQCSRLPKYMKDKYDYKLESALLDWCDEKTSAVYGWACLNDDGPVIMSDATLDRIVDCAHHHKIQTCQDLRRETGWIDSDLYGNEVLALIKSHSAPCPSIFVSTPLRQGMTTGVPASTTSPLPQFQLTAMSFSSSSSLPTTRKRQNKCSACGQEGHNVHNRICPNHPSHVIAGNKENVSQINRNQFNSVCLDVVTARCSTNYSSSTITSSNALPSNSSNMSPASPSFSTNTSPRVAFSIISHPLSYRSST
ncbi:hypothetical protein M404DRAFT_170778 [Pisolithus tinctorius Marx 270]|uniref:Uncharacterized protein n=1 Tax=Pisolithus tinctorius Marx 270 TaxID=870435 RepID=A0A0C3J7H0_PISTI|nr:hypothetical protein M404DRAFT_170778 [Pisolithus tinctorius Marx 270]